MSHISNLQYRTDGKSVDRLLVAVGGETVAVDNPYISGNLTAAGGLDFGMNVAANAQDLSEHIDLYDGAYGFCITSSSLNYNTRDIGKHKFYSGATLGPAINYQGIQFPATQNASTDPNTLDDYEEGTWTPTFAFATPGDSSFTYDTASAYQWGRYVKIGGIVTVWCRCRTTAVTVGTGSGLVAINGLPFASAMGSQYASTATGYRTGWVTNGPDVCLVLSSSIRLYYLTATSVASITNSHMSSTINDVIMATSYQVA
jgi:hypothetical protein